MKPCPDLPKGETCPLCGATYVCRQWNRPKAKQTTLDQQVADAQAEVATWTQDKRDGVRLAGSSEPTRGSLCRKE